MQMTRGIPAPLALRFYVCKGTNSDTEVHLMNGLIAFVLVISWVV